MKLDWFVFIGLAVILAYAEMRSHYPPSVIVELKHEQFETLSDTPKSLEAINKSLSTIASEIRSSNATQSDTRDFLRDQLNGVGLTPEQENELIEELEEELRAQLQSSSEAVSDAVRRQILGRDMTAKPSELDETVKPLWENAIQKTIGASELPGSTKRAVVDRLLGYADKAVETLIAEIVKAGFSGVKSLLSPGSPGIRERIEVQLKCPGICSSATSGPTPPNPEMPARFIVKFESGRSSIGAEAQSEQLWRAFNYYQQHLSARAGYGFLLRGYTDTTGTDRRNNQLRTLRARVVACELIRLGIPRTSLRLDSSQVRPPVPVSGRVAIPVNRSVFIDEGEIGVGEPIQSC